MFYYFKFYLSLVSKSSDSWRKNFRDKTIKGQEEVTGRSDGVLICSAGIRASVLPCGGGDGGVDESVFHRFYMQVPL